MSTGSVVGSNSRSHRSSSRTFFESDDRDNNSNNNNMNSRPPMTSEAGREQALRDYKLTIEYKHLKSHGPSGVYMVPAMQDFGTFHGVIFIRKGTYAHGIFKFTLSLPNNYNGVDTWPVLRFVTPVYSPLVHPHTGELDIKTTYPHWDPLKHHLITVLTFAKKIFYLTSFDTNDISSYINMEAAQLARHDPDAFHDKVLACVERSQRFMWDNHPGCTLVFQETNIAHDILLQVLKQQLGDDPSVIRRNQVFDCVTKAHNSAFGKSAATG